MTTTKIATATLVPAANKSAKPAGFEWNDETTAKAVALYEKALADGGAESANENSSLLAIAKELGAKSGSAVRSKLVSAKVYQKADQPRKVGGGSSVRKIHYVRALVKAANDKGLEIESDELDSLESSKMTALKILTDLLDIKVTAE